jgi:hypothetical protein
MQTHWHGKIFPGPNKKAANKGHKNSILHYAPTSSYFLSWTQIRDAAGCYCRFPGQTQRKVHRPQKKTEPNPDKNLRNDPV